MATYYVVPGASRVEIVTRTTAHSSHAHSGQLTGVLDVDVDESNRPRLDMPYSARLRLPVESITSAFGLQDREMRRRLDTRHHPDITVAVISATERENGRFTARAKVTVKGVTRTVKGDVSFAMSRRRIVVEGEQRLDMRDFGVEPPNIVILRVDPVVIVRVRIVAARV